MGGDGCEALSIISCVASYSPRVLRQSPLRRSVLRALFHLSLTNCRGSGSQFLPQGLASSSIKLGSVNQMCSETQASTDAPGLKGTQKSAGPMSTSHHLTRPS